MKLETLNNTLSKYYGNKKLSFKSFNYFWSTHEEQNKLLY